MIEVLDEILESEPLYDISDSNGNLLYSGVKIEMITQLIQAGTPLNKALFDIIDKILTTHSNTIKRIGRYNNPTISEYTHIKTDNLLNGEWAEVDTRKITNGFAIVKTDIGTPANAVDGDLNTFWNFRETQNYYYTIDMGRAISIKTLKMKATDTYSERKVLVYGSNTEDSLGTLLYTSPSFNTLNTLTEIELASTEPYRYYNIGCETGGGTVNLTLYEVQTGRTEEQKNLLQFSNMGLNQYEEGDTIKIYTGEALDEELYSVINIDNLGAKEIATKLAKNSYYTLIYNGNKYVAKKDVVEV